MEIKSTLKESDRKHVEAHYTEHSLRFTLRAVAEGRPKLRTSNPLHQTDVLPLAEHVFLSCFFWGGMAGGSTPALGSTPVTMVITVSSTPAKLSFGSRAEYALLV